MNVENNIDYIHAIECWIEYIFKIEYSNAITKNRLHLKGWWLITWPLDEITDKNLDNKYKAITIGITIIIIANY